MNDLSTIIIETSKLNKSIWANIYSIIDIIENKELDKAETLVYDFNIYFLSNSQKIKRITLPNGVAISEKNIGQIEKHKNIDHLIIFNKQDPQRNFSELLPFFNLLDKYKKRISIGLNLNSIQTKIEREKLYFSISQFLHSYRENKNVRNDEQIYLIYDYELTDKKTREIIQQKTARLAERKDYQKNVSREFSPLIRVDTKIKDQLFSTDLQNLRREKSNTIYVRYFMEDIRKYDNEAEKNVKKIKRKKKPSSNETNTLNNYLIISSYTFKNFFSEYFIKGLIYHLAEINEIGKLKEFYSTIYLMEKYGDGIEEIIENIIFHTQSKVGYFFFTYSNISEIIIKKYKKSLESIPLNIGRILEIYIYDFSNRGILDTYNDTKKSINLFDFFNIENISKEFSHLDLRYTAHLGLKTFHKSIISSYGYYCVETNDDQSNSKLKYIYSFDFNAPQNDSEKENFINGTHFSILLPISDKIVKGIPSDSLVTYQSKPLNYSYWLRKNINDIKSINLTDFSYSSIESKEVQIKKIKDIGNEIIRKIGDKDSIAFNYKTLGDFNKPRLVFKLLAYLQLKTESYIKVIIISNLPNNFIKSINELIENLLIPTNKIWNNHTAVVLITEYLFPYILNSETIEELTLLNQQLKLHYPRNDELFKFSDLDFNSLKNYSNKFIQPYELIVNDGQDKLFEAYVSRILDNNIEDEKIGFKLKCENVLLGSKIIVKNFYEADTLFQNSFFVDRFAFSITKQIIELKSKKELVLIGYGLYSEFLTNTIKTFIEKTNKAKVVSVIIAKNLDKDDWIIRGKTKEVLEEKFNNYNYITIVPICSTLSTNDKIIAKFKQYVNVKNSSIGNFIYNVSIILVRDNFTNINENNITEKEEEYWERITDKTVQTKFNNARNVNYLIEKNGLWFFPLDNSISFPSDYRNELPALKTKNLSVNSVRAIGWPKVKYITEQKYKEELQRIESFRNYTSIGHFDWNNSHLHYYFDTEDFINDKKVELSKWLSQINKDSFIGLNVILTPNNNIESSFVKLINEIVFNKTAFIIYIDIYNDIRDNIKHKYSFLNKLDQDKEQLRFHFVDHVLSTGESSRKARSYISSILDTNKPFESIITLINRLSFERNNELIGYYKKKTIIYEYFNLFIPPIKSPEKDCSICKSINRYEEIKEKTTINALSNLLNNKISKLQVIEFDVSNKSFIDSSRKFNRIILTHQIFYNISDLISQDKSHNEIIKYLNKCGSTDDVSFKINFVKVLSAQPLSNYQHIKNFIFSFMLKELNNILGNEGKENYQLIEFNYLIILLKNLSVFDSNALIRKDLITKVWSFYFSLSQEINISKEIAQIEKLIENNEIKLKQKTIDLFESDNIHREIKEFNERLGIIKKAENNIVNFNILFHLFVNNVTSNNEASALWLGDLLRAGEEKLDPKNITISETIPNNKLFNYFKEKGILEHLLPKYKNFLVWIYFDNTVIIRNTLDRFENEIARNKDLKERFYLASESNELRPFNQFILSNNITEIKSILRELVRIEYYHKYIGLYLEVKKPPILEKLILSLYAKLLFKNILNSEDVSIQLQHKIESILEVLSKIMEADSSFFVLRNLNKNRYRLLTSYKIDTEDQIDSLKNINDYFYTGYILNKEDNIYPITSNDSLTRNDDKSLNYKEKDKLSINAINILKLIINNKSFGSISFLHKETFEKFHIYSKETARFILSLKQELLSFIEIAYNKHSLTDLIISLDNQDKFDRIYTDSDHFYNKMVMKALSNINSIIEDTSIENIIPKLAHSYLVFSNVTITQLFANLEQHKGNLNFIKLKSKTTLKTVFSKSFLEVLQYIGDSIYKDKGNMTISSLETIADYSIEYRKELLRSFVIQCISNSMDKHMTTMDKTINIKFKANKIIIENDFPDLEESIYNEMRTDFDMKKRAIEALDCESYSSTTLTSIKAYTKAIGKDFEFGFSDKKFIVKITLN